MQVIHSARANATHNHGLDPDRLLVGNYKKWIPPSCFYFEACLLYIFILLTAEAFVGKGNFLKRVSYHNKGRSGMMTIPECRLTVVVREITPEEEAKIAKLRVLNFVKLTKRERRLVPHKLIETTPIWNRKGARTHGWASMGPWPSFFSKFHILAWNLAAVERCLIVNCHSNHCHFDRRFKKFQYLYCTLTRRSFVMWNDKCVDLCVNVLCFVGVSP